MKKMRNIMVGLLTAFILLVSISSNVFADGRIPIPAPEPVSMLLLLASGGTYAGIRYLRARRDARKSNNHSNETNENR